MHEPQVLIIDLGSQYTLVIARCLRELGVRAAVLSPSRSVQWLAQNAPELIVLSGGAASVADENAPRPPRAIFDAEVPILGICYGMQWLAQELGGRVHAARERREYGHADIRLDVEDPLFAGLAQEQSVWASHGDSIEALPPGFAQIATSSDTAGVAAMTHRARRIWGVQFHPEVTHTREGKQMLSRFVFDIAGCKQDWRPGDIAADIQASILEEIGDAKIISAVSGGVDSSVATALLAPALGDRLLGVCIDAGHLREGELDWIKRIAEEGGFRLKVLEVREKLQAALGEATDAEEKRRIFKEAYAMALREAAGAFGARGIVQGTLRTDRIESGAEGGGALIKSHHNVGLDLGVEFELHPLASLFKYEVRELARTLGLPRELAERQPFPGPGLLVRVIGAPATPERLELVRWADARVTDTLHAHGEYEKLSQLVVALMCLNTVGVKGDARVYGPSIAIRAVRTLDFMTAEGCQFPPAVRRKLTTRLSAHEGIVRVFFDETDKPPATTEFE